MVEIEIRMFDNYYGEEIGIKQIIKASRVPNIGERIMVLTNGSKYCGEVTRVLSSYIDAEYGLITEYYTIECVIDDIIELNNNL